MFNKLNLFLFIFWFFAISLIYFHTTSSFDQDLGRHIKLGEIIWQTKQVPKTNLFSYTNPNEPVFNSHWGSQVIFYFVHRSAGVGGLILLSTIINTAAFGLLFTLAVRRVGLFIPSILFVPFVFLLLDRTMIRPEMFGNLFFAILLVALFSPRVRSLVKWAFPLIALLWINLHITAVFGVFAMGVVLLQEMLDKLLHYSSREEVIVTESRSKGIWLKENVIISLFILIALLINPYDLAGVINAFTILNKYGYTIVENQSWLFLRDFGFPTVTYIAFGFVALFLSFLMTLTTRRKPLIGELILLLAASILTLRFVRNEILFAYTAFLTASFNFAAFSRIIPKASKTKNRLALAGSIFLVFLSLFIINRTHNERGLPVGFGSIESYKKGVDFFLNNNLSGPIFNNFDIGGYLIYRLYPKDPSTGSGQVVFVDNRPEAYPVEFFQNVYKPMQFDKNRFDKFAKQYGVKTIIWGWRDITDWSVAFLSWIEKDGSWKQIYTDEAIVIYTRK